MKSLLQKRLSFNTILRYWRLKLSIHFRYIIVYTSQWPYTSSWPWGNVLTCWFTQGKFYLYCILFFNTLEVLNIVIKCCNFEVFHVFLKKHLLSELSMNIQITLHCLNQQASSLNQGHQDWIEKEKWLFKMYQKIWSTWRKPLVLLGI